MSKSRLTIIFILLSIVCFAFAQKVGYKSEFESEQQIRNYFANNIALLDPLEGEYDVDVSGEYITPIVHQILPHQTMKILIVCNNNVFTVYVSDKNVFGKSIFSIKPIGETNAYWFYYDTTPTRIYLEDLIHFKASLQLNNSSANKWRKAESTSPSVRICPVYDCIKVYPTISMYADAAKKVVEEAQPTEWTGTGFALTNNYIVTNNHVVDGAKTISIQGINGDFNHKYNAEVVATDKINDLAIIKVNGISISSASIPYAVKTGTSEVGEEVFVLGYPLTSTMGEEIKLTTGVISSKTGFQGDVSIYQISAPIQPGNSGGPIFDSKGNVVGIVSAKHKGAENVGYAIKTSYLKNLMESAVPINILPQTNRMAGQNLSGKVKMVKNYVYYITCSSKGSQASSVFGSNAPSNTTLKPSVNSKDPHIIAQQILSNMVEVKGGELMIPQTSNDSLVKREIQTFFIGKFEITQEEWLAIMNSNPSRQIGSKLPIHNISWNDCQEFIRRLNSLTGRNFRLPTEAEWEFAARGGQQTHNYKYAGNDDAERVAWHTNNCNGEIHSVGEKTPNELGIYDMSGNLKEWCHDKIDNSQIKTLRWTPGTSCIIRGGSWLSGAGECGVSVRSYASPDIRDVGLGFRLAL